MAIVGASDALKLIRGSQFNINVADEVEQEIYSIGYGLQSNDLFDCDRVNAVELEIFRHDTFEAEDVLETFAVDVALMLRKKEKGFVRKLFPKENYGFVLNNIKKCFLKFDSGICNRSLKLRPCDETPVASQGQPGHVVQTYTRDIEEHFVGMKDELDQLVLKVVGTNTRVISIWGVVGLGKTTMARIIYKHPQVRGDFDAFAWVSFSEGCQISIVLLNILRQLSPGIAKYLNETSQKETIIEKLKRALRWRHSLVVLDNIQDMDQWNQLSTVLETKLGKIVILLTTREQSVAINVGSPHKLGLLNEDEGWDLLKKHAFPKKDGPDCGLIPRLGKKMVKKCGYVPSSISRLGTILSSKTSLNDWQMVYRDVSEYTQGNQNEGDVNYLDSNYANLPFNLKQCFLYLGNFSKDKEIDVEDLYFLWIAEGMVSYVNKAKKDTGEMIVDIANEDREEMTAHDIANEDREEITPDVADGQIAADMVSSVNEVMTPEDIANEDSEFDRAETYLTELASREVVRVVRDELSSTRRSQSFFLRSPARELSSWYEENKKFCLEIIDFSDAKQSKLGNFSVYSGTRRLAVDFNQEAKLKDILGLIHSRLRSLFLFNSDKKSFESCFRFSNFEKFTLLRVLNFVRCKFDGRKLPKGIDRLFNLRYLGFLHCDLDELPLFIGNLINLRALNVRVLEKSHMLVPNGFLHKLVLLKHLRLPYYAYREESYKLMLDNLLELETLFGFNSLIHDVSTLYKLQKLRRLRAHVYSNDIIKPLVSFIVSQGRRIKTELIIENKCDFSSKEGEAVLEELLMCSNLHAMTLSSVLIYKVPNCRPYMSKDLAHLKLIGCRIKEDPMEVLGKFRNLQKLCLGYGAYVGRKMDVQAHDFPKLAYLEIHSLPYFEEWSVAEGAMRNLSDVIVRKCHRLMMIPDGLESISNLKNLIIELAPEAFVDFSEEEYLKKFAFVHSHTIRRVGPCSTSYNSFQ